MVENFDQLGFDSFCENFGISQDVFAPRILKQNGVVERKKLTLEDMSRTMLLENGLLKLFWQK